ncbi:MAG TPA: RNA 2',3'-cyclic phosphodiesterase [Streptosporangiaceae bacterium]|jgi:2'-5' RNA ligase
MRLFVAITPPAAVLDEVEAAVGPLRPGRPDLRWTSPADWHITLAFLGEVAEPVLPGLQLRLDRAAHRNPCLQLSVRSAGTFGSPRRARVLWAGIHADQYTRQALRRLAQSVSAGARRAGAAPSGEDHAYRPHLTLARCRVPCDVREPVAALAGLAGSAWAATSIQLLQSNPGSQPRYQEQGSWPLRSAERRQDS